MRPQPSTAKPFRFNAPGDPTRRVAFYSDSLLGGKIWLHHDPELGGIAVGGSGIHILSADKGVEMLQAGAVGAADLLLVGRVVRLGPSEVAGMLAADEIGVVSSGEDLSNLWPRVWALTDDRDGTEVSDGVDVWWLTSQCGAEGLSALPMSELSGETLAEWVAFFARGEARRLVGCATATPLLLSLFSSLARRSVVFPRDIVYIDSGVYHIISDQPNKSC